VEAEVEPALTGVALTAAATTQLVVDPAALVTLGAEHVEATERANLVALVAAFVLELGEQLVVAGQRRGARRLELVGHLVEREREGEVVDHHVGVMPLFDDLVTSKALRVAAE